MGKRISAVLLFCILHTGTVNAQFLYNKVINNGSPLSVVRTAMLSDSTFLSLNRGETYTQNPNIYNYGTCIFLKTDLAGNKVFFNSYFSNMSNQLYFRPDDFLELPGGDLLFTGSVSSGTTIAKGMWLMKTSSNGTVIWARNLDVMSGGTGELYYGTQLFRMPSGNFLVAGGYTNQFNQKYGNAFFETNSSGSLVNMQLRETGKTCMMGRGWQDASGNVYFPYGHIGFIVRSSTGQITGNYDAEFTGFTDTTLYRQAIEGHSGNVLLLVTGYNSHTNSRDIGLASFSVSGTFQWMHLYNTPEEEYGWTITKLDGGYLMTGYRETAPLTGNTIFIYTDTDGNMIDSRISSDDLYVFDVSRSRPNQLVMGGRHNQVNVGGSLYTNRAIIVTDTLLTNVCTLPFTGITDSICTPTAVNNGMFLPGFPSSLSMDPVVPTFTANLSYINYDVCASVGLTETNTGLNVLTAAPNPFNESLSLQNTRAGGIVELFDATGRRVFAMQSTDNYTLIPGNHLSDGLYSLHYTIDQIDYYIKVIKVGNR